MGVTSSLHHAGQACRLNQLFSPPTASAAAAADAADLQPWQLSAGMPASGTTLIPAFSQRSRIALKATMHPAMPCNECRQNSEVPGSKVPVPTWILAYGGVGIVVGLATYGYKIMGMISQTLRLLLGACWIIG
jgi:phosphate/sulfate permease